MSAADVIEFIKQKLAGNVLNNDVIQNAIEAIVNGHAAKEQIGALLMAVFLKGLNAGETRNLTLAMKNSGEQLSWPDTVKGLVVDKHSTGGVGDKASLPLVPILAALGLKVPMISGRGLGLTGGTLDKLESIPGFRIGYSAHDIVKMIVETGGGIVGQTASLVPADKILYSARDITCTIESDSLIVASIISKKAAENLDTLVMEVSYGEGMFMKNKEEARHLAEAICAINRQLRLDGLGMRVRCLLTDMSNPIGRTVGNAVEVAESIEFLHGRSVPDDLQELVYKLGGHLLHMTNKSSSPEEGITMMKECVTSGRALAKFKDILRAQGVQAEFVEQILNPELDFYAIFNLLSRAKETTSLKSPKSGYVKRINARICGEVTQFKLGAGRQRPEDQVNYGVGLYLKVKAGDKIEEGQVWVEVFHEGNFNPDQLQRALEIDSEPLETTHLIGADDIMETAS